MAASKFVKIAGAFLLVLSITLPMSKCSYYEDTSGKTYSSFSGNIPDDAVEKRKKKYAFDHIHSLDLESCIVIFAFIWPVIVLGVLQWRPNGIVINIVTRGIEPLLMALSIWLVLFLTKLGEREIGAYVAFIGIGIYTIGAIWDNVSIYRIWKENNTHNKRMQSDQTTGPNDASQ